MRCITRRERERESPSAGRFALEIRIIAVAATEGKMSRKKEERHECEREMRAGDARVQSLERESERERVCV